ncbi:hypothetical protein ROTO_23470 [Roseovarius tolerans]|uniref:REase AHJR-like domain-containing protein n=1 Tax=Roseovarius tolerans TaxID=74031 RepID=A0A0L6CTN6_9RHOB|nr:hypothetical protein [Roseovarius tolerans]KNX41137.1 hypothetical protein ROTO_23470 [Roseovarius tolerans]
MIGSEIERLALEQLRPKLEQDGYIVVEDPSRQMMPPKFRGYVPDFIAQKGDDYIAFEIKAKRNESIHKKLEELKRSIEEQPNWSFKIIYADEIMKDEGPVKQGTHSIYEALCQVKAITEHNNPQAALLLAWATFEAAARHLHPKIFAKPQTPGRIVTVLAERGLIDYETASKLRTLISKRNSIVHGELSIQVTKEDVEAVTSAVGYLVAIEHD